MSDPRTLFCWSGGGMPGLDIHCGIWLALEQYGIRSTANAGTSAGAIMAAMNSAGHTPAFMESVLWGLKDADVRTERLAWKLRALWIESFLSPEPIRRLLTRLLPESHISLKKPLTITTYDERRCERYDDSGPNAIRKIVLASMSIAGVFPPVPFADSLLSDGGTVANLPLPKDWKTFDKVYLLVASPPLKYRPRRSIIGRLMTNVHVLADDQISDTIRLAQESHPHVTVIRPDVGSSSGVLRFNHSLIDSAFFAAMEILDRASRMPENGLGGIHPREQGEKRECRPVQTSCRDIRNPSPPPETPISTPGGQIA